MSNSVNKLLPLEDIRSYDIPSLWPLSWPWWLLIIFVVSLGVIATMLLRRRQQQHRAKKEALLLIMSDEIRHDPVKMLELVKRAFFSYYPRSLISHLNGTELYTILDQASSSSDSSTGFQAHSELWQHAIYAPSTLCRDDLIRCHQTCVHWLHTALPASKQQLDNLNSEVTHV
ncbi:DUF4381 domain-containing protein [Aliivibrio kagoshimensis]|uniref:DUF4381 domain-containing protein n=1 Tax=Aliivibrio kagoshimensis TaxID=2910230 RepID=UPI003D136C25